MPRDLFGRLTDHDEAPDRRYHLRRLASMVASKMPAPGDGGAMAAEPGNLTEDGGPR